MTATPALIVADPPWQLGDKLPGRGRGAAKHYDCMSVEDICLYLHSLGDLDLGQNAVLFLWRLSCLPEAALQVVRAWDFVPKTELVWEKLTRTGRPHFGMGRYLRASHETCIVATRGKCPPAVRTVRSRFAAPVGVHSQKPDEFYEIVERLYPHATKYELFARRVRPGWVQLGYELGLLGSVETTA